ncbi:MAG: helix-turn-helix transcriptional regulator [Lactobacillus sp.]|nr:helix-turn-helix transcriptional regulator [Lactobacillus sp.]
MDLKNLRQYRVSKGLTQAELAKRAGVSRTIISGLESGTSKVTTTETLLKLAKGLGTTVEDIFFDKVV